MPSDLVGRLAQEIRRVDGDHTLGAAALAEALAPFVESALRAGAEPVAYISQQTIEILNKCRNDTHNGTADVWMRPEENGYAANIPLYTRPQPATPASGWMPIELAPEGNLCIVGWRDSEDSETPDRHDFDYIEDGCWMRHEDHVQYADAVAPAGSGMPPRDPPYQWFIEVPALPTPPASKGGE